MIRTMLSAAFLTALAATALPAAEDGAMSGAEFDAYTQGKTLYFVQDGEAYGVERYMSDRRVVWSFLDGDCKDGRWYEDAGQICFVYEDNPTPQCWSFYRSGRTGLRAVFENDPAQTTLYETRQDDAPMICPGPDVGV